MTTPRREPPNPRHAHGTALTASVLAVAVLLTACSGSDGGDPADERIPLPLHFDPDTATVVDADVMIRQDSIWPGVERRAWCTALRSRGGATGERCRVTYAGGTVALAQLDPHSHELRESLDVCLDEVEPGAPLPACWLREPDQREAYRDTTVVESQIAAIHRETRWAGLLRGMTCAVMRLPGGPHSERCEVTYSGDLEAMAMVGLRDLARVVTDCHAVDTRISLSRGTNTPPCVFVPFAGFFLEGDE